VRDHWPLSITLMFFAVLLAAGLGCGAKPAPMPVSRQAAVAAGGAAKVQVRLDTIGDLAGQVREHVNRYGRQLVDAIHNQAKEGKKDAAESALAVAEAGLEQSRIATAYARVTQELASEREHWVGFRTRQAAPWIIAGVIAAVVVYRWLGNLVVGWIGGLGSVGFKLSRGLIRELPGMGPAAVAVREREVVPQ
jgi:hypothetical protein